MHKKSRKIFCLTLLLCAVFCCLSFIQNRAYKKEASPEHSLFVLPLPKKIDFSGESVPLERWEVREALDREMIVNTFNVPNTMHILKLANRIFPVLEKKLRENGIPDDFKYLCVAESSLENPISRAGAVGYWQFMEATARQYNLEINREVDERYHLEKSTDAACSYLKAAYKKFGSWTAAAASYNCGVGGYNGQVTFQKSANYYDLILPEETNRYVFRILALKSILKDPEAYGFYLQQSELYPPLKTQSITVTTSIPDLAKFAREKGTSYKMLRILNPWLRSRSLTISKGNSYLITLPDG